jgi:hypothetical protein
VAPTQSLSTWSGEPLLDAEGARIGAIEGVFRGAEAKWAAVKMEAAQVTRLVLVSDATATTGGVRVPYPAETIEAAPFEDAGGPPSPATEDELVRYYSLEDARTDRGAGSPGPDRRSEGRSLGFVSGELGDGWNGGRQEPDIA